MYSLLSKYGQVIALGIGVFFTLVLFAMIAANGATLDEAAQMQLKEGNAFLSQTSIFDIGLYAVFILTSLAALAMLVFGVLGVVKDPKGSLKSLIGIGVLLAIFVIGYMIAKSSGETTGITAAINKFNGLIEGENPTESFQYLTAGKSSMIGGALWTTFALMFLTFVGMIASEVLNLFR